MTISMREWAGTEPVNVLDCQWKRNLIVKLDEERGDVDRTDLRQKRAVFEANTGRRESLKSVAAKTQRKEVLVSIQCAVLEVGQPSQHRTMSKVYKLSK